MCQSRSPIKMLRGSEFVGQLKLDRLDYGVGKSSWVLGDEVNIRLKVITR